jgi:hypothetical protein
MFPVQTFRSIDNRCLKPYLPQSIYDNTVEACKPCLKSLCSLNNNSVQMKKHQKTPVQTDDHSASASTPAPKKEDLKTYEITEEDEEYYEEQTAGKATASPTPEQRSSRSAKRNKNGLLEVDSEDID